MSRATDAVAEQIADILAESGKFADVSEVDENLRGGHMFSIALKGKTLDVLIMDQE